MCIFSLADVWNLCPTRKENPVGQTSQKAYTQHGDCAGKHKRLCDGDCGMSCILENAKTRLAKESKNFGDEMSVTCQSGFKMATGQEMALSRCQGDRKWSLTAACDETFCPPPPEIKDGYLVAVKKQEYEVSEVIYYLCQKTFYLDVQCKIPAKRSRVLYNGKKLWITEIPEALVTHSEEVKFFCRNKNQQCSYPAPSRCFDGVLTLPE
ncbi:hypothetical protein XELAEV_18036172mg [Xenopus laevis]|uniref:Beta-2-glycoprotein 1 n=1 Tax=Xenopus laevis TaxID=8355 RepID=A0A974CH01_XENLA|nr:hypothetical protein XELAEV_18036172mg [Xenopus laevis]